VPDNNGVINTGSGAVNIVGSAFGSRPLVTSGGPAGHQRRNPDPADVGVLTVLGVELRAVAGALEGSPDYRRQQAPTGHLVHRATVSGVRVAALQALQLGQRSIMVAFEQLRQQWAPAVVVLVGVARAVDPGLDAGDVVVSDEVVYYDTRRQTPGGVLHLGQHLQAPPVIRHKLNAYFADAGEPLLLTDRVGAEYRVRRGLVGSGEAVIADPDAAVLTYLRGFNPNLLAVETEAGGVAQAVYEGIDPTRSVAGWLTVRGIADRADAREYRYRNTLAARHAADVLLRLVPYLAG